MISRRHFLAGTAAVALTACSPAPPTAATGDGANHLRLSPSDLEILHRDSLDLTTELQAAPEEVVEAPVQREPAEPETMTAPIPGAAVSSRFGPRRHPILGYVRPHTGLDFSAGYGTIIYAALSGIVVSAGRRGGYGQATVIVHQDGLATLYAHQSRLLVPEGSAVTQGDPIGLVGNTGLSTGPHLHFEVRANGKPVDPALHLGSAK